MNKKVFCEGSTVTSTIELGRTTSERGNSVYGGELQGAVSMPSVIVGKLMAVPEATGILVDFPANTSGALVPARSVVSVTEKEAGQEVALVFEDGDPAKPIIVGVLQGLSQPDAARPAEIMGDEESLILSAKKEVVIRCGKASITLTSAGKLLIQGEYVVSRSYGVNKIRGGSVQIN